MNTGAGKVALSGGRAVPLSEGASLGVPFWLVVSYFFLDYVRPQDQFSFLDPLRLGLITSIVLFVAWLAKGDKGVLKDPLIVLYGLFVLLTASTVVFAVNTFWVFQCTKALALYLIAAVLPSTTFLVGHRRILKFFNLWIVIHVILALISIRQHGRGTGSFLADENDVALAFNMAIPYAYFLSQSLTNTKLTRLLYYAALGIFLLAAVVTGSRGGFVGLVVTSAGLLFFSRRRLRKLLVLTAISSVIIALWLPKGYISDMETITDTHESTASERLYSWRRSMEMFRDNPILGVGAGNWPWRVNEYELKRPAWETRNKRMLGGRMAHSLYFTLIPELGLSGILIYGVITILLFRRLLALTHVSDKPPSGSESHTNDLVLLAKAMIVSLLAFLSTGTFISVLYYPHFWYLIGFVIALDYAARKPGAPTLHVTPQNNLVGRSVGRY